jgi:hypothetical protein
MTKLGRPRKRGRPRKPPGAAVEHRLTPKMRSAIMTLVETGCSVAEAAAAAGLTRDAIYRAMRHAPAREFCAAELKLYSPARRPRPRTR